MDGDSPVFVGLANSIAGLRVRKQNRRTDIGGRSLPLSHGFEGR